MFIIYTNGIAVAARHTFHKAENLGEQYASNLAYCGDVVVIETDHAPRTTRQADDLIKTTKPTMMWRRDYLNRPAVREY